MKKLSLVILLISIIFSCTDSWVHPWPDTIAEQEEPKPKIEHPPIDFPVSETKEPYFEVIDAGFEALLIILSIDSDNQINGKVAQSDVLSINEFTHTSPIYPLHPIVKDQKVDFLKRKYGEVPEIKSFNDIQYLQNIRNLELFIGKNLDLSHNKELERISVWSPAFDTLNLRGLEYLKEVEFKIPPMPTRNVPGEVLLGSNKSLEIFKYWGRATAIDLSSALNLKVLHLGIPDYADSLLDLSKNLHLEELVVHGNKLKKVFVSPETKAKIELDPSKWRKTEHIEWVVK